MYTYICEILVRFRSYLRVRALLAKSLKVRRHRKPSGTCRRGLSSIRALRLAWRALKLFFFREWIRRFPGFLCMRPILYVRAGKILTVFVALSLTSTQTRTYTTGRQQNMQRARRYNAAAHKHQQATPCVCDTSISALYCCGYSIVVFIGVCGP